MFNAVALSDSSSSCVYRLFVLPLRSIYYEGIMHNMEIERKFLVKDDSYKRIATAQVAIIQGYICKEAGRTVRVRLWTSKPVSPTPNTEETHAYLTIKSKTGTVGFSRFEWEKEISPADARQLLQICLPGLIEKTRWIVPYAGNANLKWEVDEFHGRMAGLVMAELELEREDQPYTKPDFIGKEVTGDPRYYNANM